MLTFSWGSSDVTTSINTFNIFHTENVNMFTAQIQTTGWCWAATVHPNPIHKISFCPPMSVLCPAWGTKSFLLIGSETVLQTNTLFCSTPINLFIWNRSRLKWRSVQRMLTPFTSILHVGESVGWRSHWVTACRPISSQHRWVASEGSLGSRALTHTEDSCQIPF